MERLQKMSVEAFVEAMRPEFERLMTEVGEAVNAAAEGRVIADSEESVHDLTGEFRVRVYERAIQMQINATEASFPPCTTHLQHVVFLTT